MRGMVPQTLIRVVSPRHRHHAPPPLVRNSEPVKAPPLHDRADEGLAPLSSGMCAPRGNVAPSPPLIDELDRQVVALALFGKTMKDETPSEADADYRLRPLARFRFISGARTVRPQTLPSSMQKRCFIGHLCRWLPYSRQASEQIVDFRRPRTGYRAGHKPPLFARAAPTKDRRRRQNQTRESHCRVLPGRLSLLPPRRTRMGRTPSS